MWAVFLRSGGETACYISDLIPTTWHLEPTWVMAYDLFPLEVIEQRKKYYAESMPGGWLTLFTHDPHVPFARIVKEDSKFSVRPV
jgi:hypothetical protein